ncbi:uncharacterized protein PRCAT00000131001 [Priceomyces carsonii]|uniref:uncharacterized protein n=1 Tax=Priceomyces carsonii TaxID=28549 RepID=UPI002ED92655|nr:unnamed protein product [Priceomyces carsonii]
MSPIIKKQKVESLPKFSSPYYQQPSNRQLVLKYLENKNKPFYILENSLEETKEKRSNIVPNRAIVHLFTRDFRLDDNISLHKASEFSKSNHVPLITCFVYCKDDFKSHSVSAIQMNYRIKSIEEIQGRLNEKNIPLVVLKVDNRRDICSEIEKFLLAKEVSHLFSNIEYEVDELRTTKTLVHNLLKKGICYLPFHNSCVVKPGELKTKSKGTPYSVFTPFYKSWCHYLNAKKEPFAKLNEPFPNSDAFKQNNKDLFNSLMPELEEMSDLQSRNFESWPIGEEKALETLTAYLDSHKVEKYSDSRNDLEEDTVSYLSPHLSSGTISPRTVLKLMVDKKYLRKVDLGEPGAVAFARQIAWRDFYRHILCNWPHICMFRPFQLDYEDINWEYNQVHFEKWCKGQTGFPIVDAAMRQLINTGYMHNRCRMIVSSFLSKNLLIDWRYGERYFLENLIDGDFASNNGGWGFSSSVGVDPQPYFRIFNAWTQSEKFDKKGTYIRKWIPELREISNEKAIHNPYGAGYGNFAKKKGYPMPIVDHKETRERALERYRESR